jgi:hypothetical protein
MDSQGLADKLPRMKTLAILLAFVCCIAAHAATTAEQLSTVCQNANRSVNSKGKFDGKRTDDIYAAGQCEGFIEGWLQGIDQGVYTVDSKSYVVTIKWKELPPSMFTIGAALTKYLKENPLESGKPADKVLLTVLVKSDLLSAAPYIAPRASLASDLQ